MYIAEGNVNRQILNVPNQLTALRLILAVVVFVLIPLQLYLPALVVFAIAASTDWVDGYYARRYGQVTKVGRIFDPFVDKIIICGAFIFLAAEKGSGIFAWMAVLVVAREMLVTALRGYIEQAGGDFSANMAGKLKMVFQCAAVVVSLWVLRFTGSPLPEWLRWTTSPWTVNGVAWLAVVSTVYSGFIYVVAAMKMLRE